MEELIAWILVAAAVIVALPFVIKWVLAGLYWFFAVLAFGTYGVLDQLFSVQLIPGAPWVMWLIWGAVFGAALGFWTVAPIYGLRKYRLHLVLAPFLLMALMALARWMVG